MSDVYYLASNTELDERKNPHIIYEKRGIRMASPFAEFYPRTFHVDKKEYENLPVKRKYVMGLDFRWREDAVEMLLQYMRNHLAKADEIEFLNVWLGGNDKIKTKKILLDQLSYEFLGQFLSDEEDCDIKKLIIVKRFY